MKYAVVKTGGKQYRVSEEEEILLEKLPCRKGQVFDFEEVLLAVSAGVVKIGQPFLSDVKVQAEAADLIKGEKIRVAKFKAKARYRRVKGHRQNLTKVKILKIVLPEEKEEGKLMLRPESTTKKKRGRRWPT